MSGRSPRNLSMAFLHRFLDGKTLGQPYTVGEEYTTLGQQYDVREKGTRKAKTEAIYNSIPSGIVLDNTLHGILVNFGSTI